MIIAEIGNNHCGDMDKAKELIRSAHNSGADIIKSQAFKAEDLAHGSMPYKFYKMCEFSYSQYMELIEYARYIGTDLFYSIFSKEFRELENHQIFRKIAGIQSFDFIPDEPEVIASVKIRNRLPYLKHTSVLHVSDYMTLNPMLETIRVFKNFYGRDVGYSDHTQGYFNCVRAIRKFEINILEKHFHTGDDIVFKGKTFRDCVHAARPFELEEIAKVMYQEVSEI